MRRYAIATAPPPTCCWPTILGGPGAAIVGIGYLRSLGDTVTVGRREPESWNRDPPTNGYHNTARHRPGACVLARQRATPDKRALLTDWMARNTTGAKGFEGLSRRLKVIDKTGTGD